MSWPWSELGLSGPAGLPEIRKAYARRLKTAHPEEDPEGFQRLHTAYQEASRWARQAARAGGQGTVPPRRVPPERSGGPEAGEAGRCSEVAGEPQGADRAFEEPEKTEEPRKRPEAAKQPKEADWDFEELLEETEEPRKRPEAMKRPKEADWDFEELLEETEEPQKRPEAAKQPKEADWDFEELLEETEEPQKHPKAARQPQETGRDYEGQETEEPQPSKAEPDWDYERLFAEGEAEAQAARRRKLEELREKNRARYAKQERDQRRRAADEEESWAAVMAAAHALELLYAHGAPLSQWQRFLDSPVFLNVRANIDFVFALEDFLEQHPDLSPAVRRAFFVVYESYNASKYPMYNRLYRLLDIRQKDKRQMAKRKSGWRLRWRSFSPWRRGALIACAGVLAVCLLVIWYCSVTNNYEPPEEEPDVPWAEQAPQWLEADYGEAFVPGPSEYLFAPAAEPNLYFWAVRDSKRSSAWPGYRTNYPYVRVRQALEAFAEAREIPLDLGDYTGHPGDAPGAYLFDLPLAGAEEDIAAIGEELARLAALPWHQPSAASRRTQQGIKEVAYRVYLCHRGLAFYEGYAPKNFDAEEALSLYAQAGPAFCRYILKDSGLAAEHLGEGYALRDQGELRIGEETFFQVSGLDGDTGEARVQYLLSGGMLFCVPQEKMENIRAVADLYRGTPRHFRLDKVGLVIVMDQVPGK